MDRLPTVIAWCQVSNRIGIQALVCLMLTSLGCTKTPFLTEETDPFAASRRQLVNREWREVLRDAEQLLAARQVSAAQISAAIQKLTRGSSALHPEKGHALTLTNRRRTTSAIQQLQHRKRMTAAASRWSLVSNQAPTGAQLRFQWPVNPAKIISGFGLRLDPFGSERRMFHNGVDLRAPVGTPVRATAKGQIVAAGFRNDGCGLGVTVVHAGGYVSDYCHLSKIFVQSGDPIREDTIIALVGTTGRTTGAHLHWSVWHRGTAKDPVQTIMLRNRSVHVR